MSIRRSRFSNQCAGWNGAGYANYTSHSLPKNEVGIAVDDKSTLKSLEERVNRLTEGMENIQKTLNRFVTLYESEKSQSLAERKDQEKLKKDVVTAKNREKQLEKKVVGMVLQMDILTSNCNRDKLQWEQERNQLQKELQHYKSLSQKIPTYNSSTQTTELFNDSSKSQCIAEAKQEQSKGWKRNSQCSCTTFKTRFAQSTNYDRPVTPRPPVVAPKMNEKRAEHMSQAGLPIKKVIIREYAQSQQSQKNAESKERYQQKSEQKIQEPVITQGDRMIELSSTPSQAAPDSKEPMINPPTHPSVNHSKPNHRQQLLESLLETHDCEHLECFVLAFRNCVQLATKCAIDSQCNRLICNRMRMRVRAEHLKVCDDQLQCALFQQGPDEENISDKEGLSKEETTTDIWDFYPY